MKTCSNCGWVKPLDEFYKHPSSKDGLTAACKECKRAYQNQYNERKREDFLASMTDIERWFWNLMHDPTLGRRSVRQTEKRTKVCHGCGQELPLGRFDSDLKFRDKRRFTRCRDCQV